MKCLQNDVLCYLFCRKDLILQLWEQLLELLKRRRSRLEKSMKLQRIFQEMINAIDWMDEIKVVIQIMYSQKQADSINMYKFFKLLSRQVKF